MCCSKHIAKLTHLILTAIYKVGITIITPISQVKKRNFPRVGALAEHALRLKL